VLSQAAGAALIAVAAASIAERAATVAARAGQLGETTPRATCQRWCILSRPPATCCAPRRIPSPTAAPSSASSRSRPACVRARNKARSSTRSSGRAVRRPPSASLARVANVSRAVLAAGACGRYLRTGRSSTWTQAPLTVHNRPAHRGDRSNARLVNAADPHA
jgi:hypothetical protein